MADSTVIHEFLVSLGFHLDASQQQRFDDFLKGSGASAAALDQRLGALEKQLGLTGLAFLKVAEARSKEQSEADKQRRVLDEEKKKLSDQEKRAKDYHDATIKRHAEQIRSFKLLAATATATGLAAVWGAVSAIREWNQLYYVSQRTNRSIAELGRLGFVGGQIGHSAQELVQAQSALSQAMRDPSNAAVIRGFLGPEATKNVEAFAAAWAKIQFKPTQDWLAGIGGQNSILLQDFANNPEAVSKGMAEYDAAIRRLFGSVEEYNKTASQSVQITRDFNLMWQYLTLSFEKMVADVGPGVIEILKHIVEGLKEVNWKQVSTDIDTIAGGLLRAARAGGELIKFLSGLKEWQVKFVAGAAGGAAVGGVVGGPAGAVVGGAVGAAAGALSTGPQPSGKGPLGGILPANPVLDNRYQQWLHSPPEPVASAPIPPYQHGGIVPRTGTIYAHGGEAVLDAHLTQMLQRVAAISESPNSFNDSRSGQLFDQWLSGGNSSSPPFVRVVGFDTNANWFGGQASGGGRGPGDFTLSGARQGGRFGGMSPGAATAANSGGGWYTGSAPASQAEHGGFNYGGLRAPAAIGGFRTYANEYAGVADTARLLQNYAKGGDDTLEKIITKWAPPSDNNNTSLLIQRAAQWSGFGAGQQLNMNDPAVLGKVLDVMNRNEFGGKRTVTPEHLREYVKRFSGGELTPYTTGNARPGGASPITGLDEGFTTRIMKMVNAMPEDVRKKFSIISGWRSQERQAQVNPGVTHSHHTGGGFGTGAAADTTWDPAVRAWITAHGGEFGLGYPLASDPKELNHMEPLDRKGQRYPGGKSIPAYQFGGSVLSTGLGFLHLGEKVLTGPQSNTFDKILGGLNSVFLGGRMGGSGGGMGSRSASFVQNNEFHHHGPNDAVGRMVMRTIGSAAGELLRQAKPALE